MAAAVKMAQQLEEGQRCVVILPDSVRNYMSKFLCDQWMCEKGFLESPNEIKPWWWNVTVHCLHLSTPLTFAPFLSCQKVIKVLKEKAFDQAPVVSESGEILGMVTLGTILSSVQDGKVKLSDPVSMVLLQDFRQVRLTDNLGKLSCIFKTQNFALVVDDQTQNDAAGSVCPRQNGFGVATAIDLLNFITTHEGQDHP